MQIITDNKITLRAKALYFYIRSKNEQIISIEELKDINKDGVISITTGIKELIQNSYIERVKERGQKDSGRIVFLGYSYKILK